MWIVGRHPPAFVPALDCLTLGAVLCSSIGFSLYLFTLPKAALLYYYSQQCMPQDVLPVLGSRMANSVIFLNNYCRNVIFF